MELVRLYNDAAIEQIYSNLLQLSILNYQQLPEAVKETYKEKYQRALLLQTELNEPPFDTREDILEFLASTNEAIQEISKQNQPTIDLYASQIENFLMEYMPGNLNVVGKLEFLFDFITRWISYSEDAFQYCFNIPPINGFFFDFYQGVPLSTSYSGLLVTRQGLCGDISNLFVYLARLLGIDVGTVSCTHGKNYHTINQVRLQGGAVSYIDATACIRGLKNKQESFLVSGDVLNKDQDYQLKDTPSVTLKKLEHCPYHIDDFISYLQTPPIISIHKIDPAIKS